VDPLSPPTAKESASLTGGFALALLAAVVGAALSVAGAGTWPRLEPLFFWLMLGVFGLLIAAGVRFKAGYARTHHADGSGPSAYDLRVSRRLRVLGVGAVAAWIVLAAVSLAWPATTLFCAAAGFLALVAALVAFGFDEARAARREAP
jgi:hypothetical protein